MAMHVAQPGGPPAQRFPWHMAGHKRCGAGSLAMNPVAINTVQGANVRSPSSRKRKHSQNAFFFKPQQKRPSVAPTPPPTSKRKAHENTNASRIRQSPETNNKRPPGSQPDVPVVGQNKSNNNPFHRNYTAPYRLVDRRDAVSSNNTVVFRDLASWQEMPGPRHTASGSAQGP
jgi:hypothetical protein|uniref:Uncharacterized protein n=1 Tax=Eutreptiella gymnastica TaxID=73025 RepID=A0A7S4CWF9_9EUGL|mmetsp:Transcript_65388/g.108655  ORF Transcript_65388/g.108655 Transcript_65388/m.108655 type:complete len:173 (-) Transcript_65388:110-628(-)